MTRETNYLNDRAYINKALNSGRYDYGFVDLCRKRSQSNHNLSGVISDIDSYGSSNIGQAFNYQIAVKKMVSKYDKPLAINLTCRFDISIEDIKKKFEVLIKTISSNILKNAYKRHGKTISNNAFVEGGPDDKRVHIHAIIDVPSHINMKDIKDMISTHWSQTGLTDFDNNIKRDNKISAIANYISKMDSKTESVAKSFLWV